MTKKILAIILVLLTVTTAVFAANFSDFDDGHWAASAVNALVDEGTIGGYEDGTFKPNGIVTRAEFVKMIGNGPTRFEKDFNDVAQSFWAYDYIMNSGLEGDANGNFNPNVPITRGDVLGLLWKRAGSPAGYSVPKIISDQGENKASIAWGYSTGIMAGNDTMTLRLSDTMTRAEGALLIIRARNSEASSKGFIDIISGDILKMVYNDSKLLTEVAYNENYELTYGELSRAAVRLRSDEHLVSYSNLAAKKYPLEGVTEYLEYAPDLFIMGRDVLGDDKVTAEFYNKKATVQDAIIALSFAVADLSNGTLSLNNKDNYYKEVTTILTENGNKALTLAYENDVMLEANKALTPNKILTAKEFAAIVLQLDHISGVFNKYIFTAGTEAVIEKINTTANFAPDTLPAYKEFYQVIAKEVPGYVYDNEIDYTAASNPKNNFDFSRQFLTIFADYYTNIANQAKENGVDVKFTYYPTLCHEYSAGYYIRTKVEILNAKQGAKLSDITASDVDKTISAGMTFFADFDSGVRSMSFVLPIEDTIIKKVIELK